MLRKILAIFFIISVTACFISAQENVLNIKPVKNSKTNYLPDKTYGIAFKLTNSSNKNLQFYLKLSFPDNWKCFSNLKNINISGQKSTIKILSINIPDGCPAGKYSVKINAIDEKTGKTLYKGQMPFIVLPNYRLNVNLLGAPEYVFSGDTFSVSYMVQNLSNSTVEIETKLQKPNGIEKIHFTLQPDSSKIIMKKVKAEKVLSNSARKNISLTAFIADMPEVNSSSYHYYTIIPSGEVAFDPYNRFPVTFSTLLVTSNRCGKKMNAILAETSGKGFLDNKKSKSLSFRLRGPDRRGEPLYGINDEYFLNYRTQKSNLFVGDGNYRLSYLTENSRYARGIRYEHSFSKIKLGSFINYPRYYPKIKRLISVYADYTFSGNFQLNGGYINKSGDEGERSHLFTLNGIALPFRWAKIDWEYATGLKKKDFSHAIKTELRIVKHPFRFYGFYTKTGKDFTGYFTDTKNIIINGNIKISKKIDIGANYKNTCQNTALDTIYGSAPISKNASFLLNYKLTKKSGFSVSYNFRYRKDRMQTMKFYYNENSIRLTQYHLFKNFKFDIKGEYGLTENFLIEGASRFTAMYLGQLNLNFKASGKVRFNSFVTYQKNERYLVSNQKNWYYGLTANMFFSKKLNFSIDYKSNFNVEEYYRNREILNGQLNLSPWKNGRFELSAWHNLKKNTLNVKEFSFILRYKHTLNIPVCRKKDVGKLSGKIINNGVDKVDGIKLSIGSHIAISDKKGNYCFPSLPIGTYPLTINFSEAGMYSIPEKPTPFIINIRPGENTHFDIALTKAASISGEIVVTEDKNSYVSSKTKPEKILIEVQNGEEVFRSFTNDKGYFSFENLRPGIWKVKVHEEMISKEYILTTNLFNIELMPGSKQDIEVKIKKKQRHIKFQKTFSRNVLPEITKQKPSKQPGL